MSDAKMKLLVVSEGNHELHADRESGALIQLLRRMLPPNVEFQCRKVSDPCVATIPVKGKQSGQYEKRALRWLRFAEQQGFDGLILLVDEDGVADRTVGLTAAQVQTRIALPRAFGVAIRTFDAWMLADETAISSVLAQNIQRQKSPEDMSNPKAKNEELLRNPEVNSSLSLTDYYAAIAKEIHLDTLSDRCPRGFRLFQQRVGELVA